MNRVQSKNGFKFQFIAELRQTIGNSVDIMEVDRVGFKILYGFFENDLRMNAKDIRNIPKGADIGVMLPVVPVPKNIQRIKTENNDPLFLAFGKLERAPSAERRRGKDRNLVAEVAKRDGFVMNGRFRAAAAMRGVEIVDEKDPH
jgi:hypothetical protein